MKLNNVADVIAEFEQHPVCFLFFWGHRPSADGRVTISCLSQWYSCSFVVDGVTYHTAEQYMMAQKAKLFGDFATYQKIMAATNPREYKSLGRAVTGYDDRKWAANRQAIVTTGNINKFSQNKELRDYLIATKDYVLVEASPYDKIWGVGMSRDNPDIIDPKKWRGQNLLGFSLMAAREAIS